MPVLKIFTSLARDKIPENFVHKIVPILSKTLRKPADKFVVLLSTDSPMSFGGNRSGKPGAVATLESIGNLGYEENNIIAKEVTNFVQKELGIEPDQFLLTFYDLRKQDLARDGHTIL